MGNMSDKFQEAEELQAQMALLKSRLETLGISDEPTENLTVPLARSIKNKLSKQCKEQGLNMAVVCRKLITEYVQKQQQSKS